MTLALRETTGRARGRIYSYVRSLEALNAEPEQALVDRLLSSDRSRARPAQSSVSVENQKATC